MHLQRLFLPGLVLLAVPTAVAAKRKGGGGIDLGDSSSSDGDSSSDQGGYAIIPSDVGGCPDTSIFSNIDASLLPSNVYNWTSKDWDNRNNPTAYDGSYFEGVASMQWRFTNECRNTTDSVRMRGYAWVGPQPPYPKGPTNPLIISIRAWQLSEVFESSFDGRLFCAPDPAYVKLETSTQLGHRTLDIVHLDFAPDVKHLDTVLFNGSMVPGYQSPPEPRVSCPPAWVSLRWAGGDKSVPWIPGEGQHHWIFDEYNFGIEYCWRRDSALYTDLYSGRSCYI
jgi:hypothetical protein